MSITVNNNTAEPIKVSINKWDKNGDTNYSTIKPSNKDSWDRDDSRGFVMFVSESHAKVDGPYYVMAGSDVHFYSDGKVTGAVKISY